VWLYPGEAVYSIATGPVALPPMNNRQYIVISKTAFNPVPLSEITPGDILISYNASPIIKAPMQPVELSVHDTMQGDIGLRVANYGTPPKNVTAGEASAPKTYRIDAHTLLRNRDAF
jgi:hypothetical protein